MVMIKKIYAYSSGRQGRHIFLPIRRLRSGSILCQGQPTICPGMGWEWDRISLISDTILVCSRPTVCPGLDWARSGLISAQYGARNDPLPDHDGTGLIEGTILVCFQPIISPGQKWDKKWASLWPDIGARPCRIWPVFCPGMDQDGSRQRYALDISDHIQGVYRSYV